MNKILKSVLTFVLLFSVGTSVNAESDEQGNGDNTQKTYVAEIGDTQYESLSAAIAAVGTEKTTITLINDETVSYAISISENKDIILDLNGKTFTTSNPLKVDNGKLEVKDGTVTVDPVVSEDYSTVTYQSGKIVLNNTRGAGLLATNGGQITLTSGTILATNKNGLGAQGDLNGSKEIKSTVTINGGYIQAQECAVIIEGKGATAVINNGVLKTVDNFVVGGNGNYKEGYKAGGTTININGGTLIGNIKTSGYISAAIYHPQEGTLNISGGTLYSSNGNVICIRGGKVNISGNTKIIAKGNSSGKVGDSKVVTSSSDIFVDYDSKYYDSNNIEVNITGGEFTADVTAIEVLGSEVGKVTVEGGTYSSDVSKYLVEGYDLAKIDGKYVVVKKGENAPVTSPITPAVDETAFEEVSSVVTSDVTGTTVTGVKLEANQIEKVVDEEKTKVEDAIKSSVTKSTDVEILLPLDVNLKAITTNADGTSSETSVTSLNKAITATIYLDEATLATLKDKTIKVVREHTENDVTTYDVLDATLEANALKFVTDKFSKYYVVTYKVTTLDDTKNNTSTTTNKVTSTTTTKSTAGWDDGGPFTTDNCGNVFDRWGNKIYEAKGCNVGGYNLVRTSVED